MTRVRDIEAGCSDFDLDDQDGSNDPLIAVSFIAVLPILFGVLMIGLAFWVLK